MTILPLCRFRLRPIAKWNEIAGFSHILTKFMDAQRRAALFFVTQGVSCASCMCDWGIIYREYKKKTIDPYLSLVTLSCLKLHLDDRYRSSADCLAAHLFITLLVPISHKLINVTFYVTLI